MDSIGLLASLLGTSNLSVVSKSGGVGSAAFTMSIAPLQTLKVAIIFVQGVIPYILGNSGSISAVFRSSEILPISMGQFTLNAHSSGSNITVSIATNQGGISVTVVAFGIL